ncbi:MAG TPA: PAS domain S-box protein, partial [Spirochaetota bacterium]
MQSHWTSFTREFFPIKLRISLMVLVSIIVLASIIMLYRYLTGSASSKIMFLLSAGGIALFIAIVLSITIIALLENAHMAHHIRTLIGESAAEQRAARKGKYLEAELSDSISRMQSRIVFSEILMHTIPSAVIVTDFKGNIIQANNSCRIMFCPDHELVGSSLTEILAAEFQERKLIDAIKRAGTEGKSSLYWEGLCVDSRFPIFFQLQQIHLEGDDFLLAVITDISDMKNASDEIFFRTSLLDNALDSIIAFHQNGRISYANREACRLHQYSMEEILSLSAEDLIFSTSVADYRVQMSNLETHPSLTFELWHRRKSGTFVPVETHCSRVPVNNELLTIETHHDLTTIKASQHALRESEERFRSFFDNAKDCVFIATSNGFLLNINNAGRVLLGIGDIDPKEIDLFSFFDAPDARKNFSQLISSYGFVKDFKTEFRRDNGTNASVEINATFFHNPLYHITGYHGFIRDITHEKLMEAQVRQAQKLDAIGRLAGGVAHDFNNILTIILGNAEIALLSIDPDDQMYEPLSEIKESAERAAKLTTQLLAFSRKQVVEPEIVNADTLIHDLHKMLTRLIGENIKLELKLNGESCPIKVDRSQFEQIILNLVVNARDAINEKNDASDRKVTIETMEGSPEDGYMPRDG